MCAAGEINTSILIEILLYSFLVLFLFILINLVCTSSLCADSVQVLYSKINYPMQLVIANVCLQDICFLSVRRTQHYKGNL